MSNYMTLSFVEFGFLSEAVEAEQHLKHLTHAEDRVIYGGRAGFHHVHDLLKSVHSSIKGEANQTKVTVKKDGSPSIVAGYHPTSGKFFVASKSVFNKEPKINYSPEDIEKNHGHAPGLVEKLKSALHHLPKVMPKSGVYQGDMMYTSGDIKSDDTHHSFTPNTITYSASKDSEHGKQIAAAKMGVAFHTKYEGPSLDKMKATFNPDSSKFKKHKDVHVISVQHDTAKSSLSPMEEKSFSNHLMKAKNMADKAPDQTFHAMHGHEAHLETYINHTVRTGSAPTVAGYKEHLHGRLQKEVDKVKTDKSKIAKSEVLTSHMKHIDEHAKHIGTVLQIHHHVQQAKNILIKSLDAHQEFKHTIAGKKANPEGYVAVHQGVPTKLVNREEFSKANFDNNRGRAATVTEGFLGFGKKKESRPEHLHISDEDAHTITSNSHKLHKGYVNDYHKYLKSDGKPRTNINIHSHSKSTGLKKEGYLRKHADGYHLRVDHYGVSGSTHGHSPLVSSDHKLDNLHDIHKHMNE